MGCSASAHKPNFERNSSTIKETNIDIKTRHNSTGTKTQNDRIDTKTQEPFKINCVNLETESLKLKEETNNQKSNVDIGKENNQLQNKNLDSKDSYDNGNFSSKEQCTNGSQSTNGSQGTLDDVGDVMFVNASEYIPNNSFIESTLVETCNNESLPINNSSHNNETSTVEICNNDSLSIENSACNNESSTVETCNEESLPIENGSCNNEFSTVKAYNNEFTTIGNNSCNIDVNEDLEIIVCQSEEIQQSEMVPSEEPSDLLLDTCDRTIEQ